MKLTTPSAWVILGCLALGLPPACSAQRWSVLVDPYAPTSAPQVVGPVAVAAAPDGSLYVAYGSLYQRDGGLSAQLSRRDPQGQWSVIAQQGRLLGEVAGPSRLAVGLTGELVVTDRDNRRVASRGTDSVWQVVADQEQGRPQVVAPSAVRIDHAGGLWISDYGQLLHRGADGSWNTEGALNEAGPLDRGDAWVVPGGLALLPDGGLLLCEVQSLDARGANGLHYRNATGQWAVLEQGLEATGLVADATGNLYTAEPRQNRVRLRTPQGVWSVIAGEGTLLGQVRQPQDVTLDAQGRLLIADGGNGRVLVYNPQAAPMGIEGDVDGNGSVSIADVLALLRVVAGLSAAEAGDLETGDLSHNGVLDIQDVVLLLRRVAGL